MDQLCVGHLYETWNMVPYIEAIHRAKYTTVQQFYNLSTTAGLCVPVTWINIQQKQICQDYASVCDWTSCYKH